MLGLTEKPVEVEWEPIDYPAPPPRLAAIAKDILNDVMRFRRSSGHKAPCAASPCPRCSAPHVSKVISSVALGLPVTLVLPAFPGKSPNPAKVLGTLPDMAEW